MAFHYVDPSEMYVFEYLNYNLNVYSAEAALAEQLLPEKMQWSELRILPLDNA